MKWPKSFNRINFQEDGVFEKIEHCLFNGSEWIHLINIPIEEESESLDYVAMLCKNKCHLTRLNERNEIELYEESWRYVGKMANTLAEIKNLELGDAEIIGIPFSAINLAQNQMLGSESSFIQFPEKDYGWALLTFSKPLIVVGKMTASEINQLKSLDVFQSFEQHDN